MSFNKINISGTSYEIIPHKLTDGTHTASLPSMDGNKTLAFTKGTYPDFTAGSLTNGRLTIGLPTETVGVLVNKEIALTDGCYPFLEAGLLTDGGPYVARLPDNMTKDETFAFQSDLDKKVNKAGDTMSGQLTVPYMTINNTTDNSNDTALLINNSANDWSIKITPNNYGIFILNSNCSNALSVEGNTKLNTLHVTGSADFTSCSTVSVPTVTIT